MTWVEGAAPLPSVFPTRRHGTLEGKASAPPLSSSSLNWAKPTPSKKPHLLVFPTVGKAKPCVSTELVVWVRWKVGRNHRQLPGQAAAFSTHASQEPERECTGDRAHHEMLLSAGKAFFCFIIFSFCSYYFSERGGESSWGISLKVYITGEKKYPSSV